MPDNPEKSAEVPVQGLSVSPSGRAAQAGKRTNTLAWSRSPVMALCRRYSWTQT